MAKRIMDEYRGIAEIAVVFANTGQEHERTLEFVHKCDKAFDLGVTWIESVVHHGERIASSSRVTNFKEATRDGSLFEEMIKKYGIPNMSFPHCTRELKTNPLHHYIRKTLGWEKGSYYTAIGIRNDEIDRVNSDFKSLKYWYPLIEWGIKKSDIAAFWRTQPFMLEIPEHLGNCVWCWKKSLKKQMAVIRDAPNAHDVPCELEKRYPVTIKGENVFTGQTFFRQNKSVEDLRLMYVSGSVDPFTDDEYSGCQESCEPMQ